MRTKALAAEFIGTFALVASILGAALFSFPVAGIVGVALSLGFTVMAMAYAVGRISGGHFNPAVTLGLVAGPMQGGICQAAFTVCRRTTRPAANKAAPISAKPPMMIGAGRSMPVSGGRPSCHGPGPLAAQSVPSKTHSR